MIEIVRLSDGITIRGHAGYADHGNDIVCAGVSTLVQTLIQSIEALTTDAIRYDIEPGYTNIEHGNLSDSGQLLIDSFFCGIELISGEYPDCVEITYY